MPGRALNHHCWPERPRRERQNSQVRRPLRRRSAASGGHHLRPISPRLTTHQLKATRCAPYAESTRGTFLWRDPFRAPQSRGNRQTGPVPPRRINSMTLVAEGPCAPPPSRSSSAECSDGSAWPIRSDLGVLRAGFSAARARANSRASPATSNGLGARQRHQPGRTHIPAFLRLAGQEPSGGAARLCRHRPAAHAPRRMARAGPGSGASSSLTPSRTNLPTSSRCLLRERHYPVSPGARPTVGEREELEGPHRHQAPRASCSHVSLLTAAIRPVGLFDCKNSATTWRSRNPLATGNSSSLVQKARPPRQYPRQTGTNQSQIHSPGTPSAERGPVPVPVQTAVKRPLGRGMGARSLGNPRERASATPSTPATPP